MDLGFKVWGSGSGLRNREHRGATVAWGSALVLSKRSSSTGLLVLFKRKPSGTIQGWRQLIQYMSVRNGSFGFRVPSITTCHDSHAVKPWSTEAAAG